MPHREIGGAATAFAVHGSGRSHTVIPGFRPATEPTGVGADHESVEVVIADGAGGAPGGVELVIAEWDRATRSMWDGLQIIKAVIDAGAAIKVLDRSYIDLATPMGRGFMAMMSAMAEDERLRIIKRTHEGRQIARAKGVRMGRKPKLTPHQIKEAQQRLAQGEPTRSLAKSYGVSVSTISRLAG